MIRIIDEDGNLLEEVTPQELADRMRADLAKQGKLKERAHRKAEQEAKNVCLAKAEEQELDKLNKAQERRTKKVAQSDNKNTLIKLVLSYLAAQNYGVGLLDNGEIGVAMSDADYTIKVTKKKDRLEILHK